MQRHVDEINNAIARSKVQTVVKSAFLISKVGLNVAAAAVAILGLPTLPTYATGLGNAVVLVAENVVGKRLPSREVSPDNPAAMFCSARQELGELELQRLFEFG